MLSAIGASLPLAVAIALSPFPVIAIIVILTGSLGRRNGAPFAAGWTAGLSALTVLAVLVFDGAYDGENSTRTAVDWLRVIAGLGLIGVAVHEWRSRPRPGEEAKVPGWMASLDGASRTRSLALGALLSANPKNLVLIVAAATGMLATGAEGADLAVAVAVFVLLSASTVIGAVVASLAGGARAAAFLESVRQFMVANSAVIMMVVLLILGAKVLGDGISGLSS